MRDVLVSNFGTTRFAAGIGSADRLAEELPVRGLRKPLLVADPGIANTDKFRRTVSAMEQAGLRPISYDKITPNPKDYEVMEGVEVYKAQGCDCVVGIGGGSNLDCAKGIAAMVRHEGDVMDYGRSTPNRRFFTNGREPLFCVPTSTGTGSELSPHAVITNTKRNNRKSDVMATEFYCDMFFLDPEFAVSQPRNIARDTAVDALSHTIDSYTNRKMLTLNSPLHEALAMQSISLIAGNLRQVLANGGANLEQVMALQWGANFGGALLDLDASLIHGLSGVLQKHRPGMTHGVSCGIIMAACMEYNLQSAPEKFAKIARQLGVNTDGMTEQAAAKASVTAIRGLLEDIDFPRFADYDFSEEEIDEMAETTVGNSMLPFNPRPVRSKEDIAWVYRRSAGLI